MAHYNVEFPRNIARGCQASILRRDEIVELASGHEESNQRWKHARRSWDAGLAVRTSEEMQQVIDLFEEMRGRANSFHFRDWQDWRSSVNITPHDQPLGIGDGKTKSFQLIKRYGRLNPYDRPIALPHPFSLRLAIDGEEKVSGWTLSAIGGLVEFEAPPPMGATLNAGFSFDVPTRFSEPSLDIEWAYFSENSGYASAPRISLLEIRLDLPTE